MVSLVFFVLVHYVQAVNAQEQEQQLPYYENDLQIHIPHKMIVGETYYGIIVSKTPAYVSDVITATSSIQSTAAITTTTTDATAIEPLSLIDTTLEHFWSIIFGENHTQESTIVTPTPQQQQQSSSSQQKGRIIHLAFNHETGSNPPIKILSSHNNTVILPYGMNHAIFKFQALRDGITTVHASYDGRITHTTSTIHSLNTGPKTLDLILPGNTTSTSNLNAIIMIKDGNNYPTTSNKDIKVRIIPTNLIETPNEIIITAGQTHTVFPIVVQSTGQINVVSEGLISDTENIAYETDKITVKLGIAPNVALVGGTVQYVVWLERNGVPFYPPHTIKGELQTTNTDAVRFTPYAPPHKNDNNFEFTMYDGIATGVLYAAGGVGVVGNSMESPHYTSDNFATITAIIPEYGVAYDNVCVGSMGSIQTNIEKTELENYHYNNNNENENENTKNNNLTNPDHNTNPTHNPIPITASRLIAQGNSTGCTDNLESINDLTTELFYQSTISQNDQGDNNSNEESKNIQNIILNAIDPTTNLVKLWLYPDDTSFSTYAIVGFYNHKETEYFVSYVQDNQRVDITSKVILETPTKLVNQYITASSNNKANNNNNNNNNNNDGELTFQSTHVVQPTVYTNMYTFPILSGHEGSHDISITTQGSTATDTLRVIAPHQTQYKLQVQTIPIALEEQSIEQQPLAFITITDSADRILDIKEEFGVDRIIHTIFSDSRTPKNTIINQIYNTGILYDDNDDDSITEPIVLTSTLEGTPGAVKPAIYEMTPIGIPVAVDMFMPHTVHIGEIFPITVHLVDTYDTPILRMNTTTLPPTGLNFMYENGFGMLIDGVASNMHKDEPINPAEQQQIISILHEQGGSTTSMIRGFLNPSDYNIFGVPNVVSAGDSFEFQVAASSFVISNSYGNEDQKDIKITYDQNGDIVDAYFSHDDDYNDYDGNAYSNNAIPIPAHIPQSYEIINHNTAWDYTQISPGKFNITAHELGNHNITMRINIMGYESQTIVIPFSAKMSVPIIVKAVSADGSVELEADFDIITSSSTTTIIPINNTKTPFSTIFTQPDNYEFVFKPNLDHGYALTDIQFTDGGILVNDNTIHIRPSDNQITIIATYENRVYVNVIGGHGTGTYQYGETIILQATPADVIPFIMPTKLAYWDGAPGGFQTDEQIHIIADRDMNIFAIYEPDYTRILYAVIIGMVVVGVMILRRFGSRIMYQIGELSEYVKERKTNDYDDEEGGGEGGGETKEEYYDNTTSIIDKKYTH